MPMNRFWSSFWTVAGFLFLIGWLQLIIDTVVTLFGVVDIFAPAVAVWIRLISRGVVPIWGVLKFIDWRWGWKPDNAGFRIRPTAAFWLLPGLVAGAAAVAVTYLITGGQTLTALELTSPSLWLMAVLWAVVIFASEVVYRGALISRFQQDLPRREMLLLALAMPLVWTFAQVFIGRVLFINPNPFTGITTLGTAALSLCLSLLFLRTDSVWLTAGIRIPVALLGAEFAGLFNARPLISDQGLVIVFGIPAVILLVLEIGRLGNVRRPGGGPRRGPQRVVYGKTLRGPWGPH